MRNTGVMKAAAFLLILFLGLPGLIAAQEDGNDPDYETDWDDYSTDLYSEGDQTLTISLGVMFPVVFISNGEVIENKFSPPVGGTGSLAFSYFLSPLFFIGGEVGGAFIPTLAQNTVFFIMLGARAGVQFNVWRFEFPIAFTVGMSWQTYLNQGYYGLYLKGGGGAYFRATRDWSFGLLSNWHWFPQRTEKSSQNVDGNFIDLTLSARYRF
jgi:hypothetical protein